MSDMTYQFASTNLRNVDFQTRCALAVATLAANKIVGQVAMTPFEENMAKIVVKDPMSYANMITSVMLQVATMQSRDCTVTMPTDAEFNTAATSIWPYLVAIVS